jgi:hypothetical protein
LNSRTNVVEPTVPMLPPVGVPIHEGGISLSFADFAVRRFCSVVTLPP